MFLALQWHLPTYTATCTCGCRYLTKKMRNSWICIPLILTRNFFQLVSFLYCCSGRGRVYNMKMTVIKVYPLRAKSFLYQTWKRLGSASGCKILGPNCKSGAETSFFWSHKHVVLSDVVTLSRSNTTGPFALHILKVFVLTCPQVEQKVNSRADRGRATTPKMHAH